ncbi:MAG: molybdenum cofactor guanylyltransferase MobA [Sulfurospirillum sp.]
MLPLPCIIVAGGKSSRMGQDKALLSFGEDKTLTQYQLKRIKSWFKNVYVSCKDKSKFDFAASFIEDTKEFDEFSPLIALYSALKKLQTPLVILSVDTPFVSKAIFEELYKNSNSFDAIIAKSPFGSHQMCAIYKPSILPTLKGQISDNNHKIRELLKKIKTRYVEFSDDKPFMNLNKISEYEKAKLLI